MSNSWRRIAWPIESDESEDERSNKTKTKRDAFDARNVMPRIRNASYSRGSSFSGRRMKDERHQQQQTRTKRSGTHDTEASSSPHASNGHSKVVRNGTGGGEEEKAPEEGY